MLRSRFSGRYESRAIPELGRRSFARAIWKVAASRPTRLKAPAILQALRERYSPLVPAESAACDLRPERGAEPSLLRGLWIAREADSQHSRRQSAEQVPLQPKEPAVRFASRPRIYPATARRVLRYRGSFADKRFQAAQRFLPFQFALPKRSLHQPDGRP